MTREYILQNLEVMCPIIFIDNPGLRDYVMSTLQDSILIPKPKFKVGDKFREYSVIFEIENVFYDFNLGTWVYGYWWGGTEFCTIRESELELTERKKNE